MVKTLLLLLLTGSLMNCSKQVVTTSCNVNTDYTRDADQARKWIVGRWKLTRVTSMMPDPKVDNLVLTFSDKGEVTALKDDKPISTNTYQIVADKSNLVLKTDAEPAGNNGYVRNPIVCICYSELFLDGGIAYDGPGYTFQRID